MKTLRLPLAVTRWRGRCRVCILRAPQRRDAMAASVQLAKCDRRAAGAVLCLLRAVRIWPLGCHGVQSLWPQCHCRRFSATASVCTECSRTCDGCRALAIAADRQGRRRVRRGVCRLGDAWSANARTHARTHTHRWFTVGSGIHQLAKLVVLIIDVSDSMRVRVITRCSQSGRRLE